MPSHRDEPALADFSSSAKEDARVLKKVIAQDIQKGVRSLTETLHELNAQPPAKKRTPNQKRPAEGAPFRPPKSKTKKQHQMSR